VWMPKPSMRGRMELYASAHESNMRGHNQSRCFEGCSSLSSIFVDALNTCYKVADRILFVKTAKP
jgi:hypothetical protein